MQSQRWHQRCKNDVTRGTEGIERLLHDDLEAALTSKGINRLMFHTYIQFLIQSLYQTNTKTLFKIPNAKDHNSCNKYSFERRAA